MKNTPKLKSNGYGSFIQNIVIRIDQEHAEKVGQALRSKPFRVENTHHDFTWKRKTTQAGRDDHIVFEFGIICADIPHGSYQFLWDESEY